MAEKIPFETLLPIALELFSKVPHEKQLSPPKGGRPQMLEDAAEDFARFYHSLHQKLTHRDE